MEANPPIRRRTRLKTASPASETAEVPESATQKSGGDESGDYDVGYRKPPTKSQFKSGRSGNPKGRPKGIKNFKTELAEELQERVVVREGGKTQAVSKQRAMLKRLTEKALKGDARAASLIVNMVFRIFQQDEEPVDEQGVSAEDRAILDDYENRIRRNTSAQNSPKPRKGDPQ